MEVVMRPATPLFASLVLAGALAAHPGMAERRS
jgi:hypothetical protein